MGLIRRLTNYLSVVRAEVRAQGAAARAARYKEWGVEPPAPPVTAQPDVFCFRCGGRNVVLASNTHRRCEDCGQWWRLLPADADLRPRSVHPPATYGRSGFGPEGKLTFWNMPARRSW